MTSIHLGSIYLSGFGALKDKTRNAEVQFAEATRIHSTMCADFDACISKIKQGVLSSKYSRVILADLVGNNKLIVDVTKKSYEIIYDEPFQAIEGAHLLNALGIKADINSKNKDILIVDKKEFDAFHKRFTDLKGKTLKDEVDKFKEERLEANGEVWSKKLTELKEKWQEALNAEVSWVEKLQTTPTPAKTHARPRK